MQPQPAVAAEHGDAFGELVEGFALNVDQLLETTFKDQPFADIVKQISHAAVGIGRSHHPQGASIRQMPGVVFRFDGAIGLVQLRLPLPKVALLGQLAAHAQEFNHGGIGRALIQKPGVEIPQRSISLVVERQSMTGVEHGDPGRKLIEGAAVRIRKPRERAAHAFDFGRIDDNAGAASFGIDFEHLEGPQRAPDGSREPAGIGAPREPRLGDAFARRLIQNLEPAIDRFGRAFGLDCPGIGRIDERQLSGRASRPHWGGQRLDYCPQGSRFRRQILIALQQFDKFALDAGGVFQSQYRMSAKRAALRLERVSGERTQRH